MSKARVHKEARWGVGEVMYLRGGGVDDEEEIPSALPEACSLGRRGGGLGCRVAVDS